MANRDCYQSHSISITVHTEVSDNSTDCVNNTVFIKGKYSTYNMRIFIRMKPYRLSRTPQRKREISCEGYVFQAT